MAGRAGWAVAVRSARWRRQLLVALAGSGVLALVVPAVFAAVRERPGAEPWEPLLDHLPPLQLSVPIFALQYVAIVLATVRMMRRPDVLPRALQAVVLLVAMRMVTIGVVALDPPPDLVPLRDPVNQLLYGGDQPLTRDLFFSGHTALMVLLVLLAGPGIARWATVSAAAAVAVLLLLQHVHWTIDVLAAPVFAVIAWWLSGRTAPTPARPVRVPTAPSPGSVPDGPRP